MYNKIKKGLKLVGNIVKTHKNIKHKNIAMFTLLRDFILYAIRPTLLLKNFEIKHFEVSKF